MIHMVKINILTGHEEKGNLHVIMSIILSFYIYRKPMYFLETCTIFFESKAYCLTKFC